MADGTGTDAGRRWTGRVRDVGWRDRVAADTPISSLRGPGATDGNSYTIPPARLLTRIRQYTPTVPRARPALLAFHVAGTLIAISMWVRAGGSQAHANAAVIAWIAGWGLLLNGLGLLTWLQATRRRRSRERAADEYGKLHASDGARSDIDDLEIDMVFPGLAGEPGRRRRLPFEVSVSAAAALGVWIIGMWALAMLTAHAWPRPAVTIDTLDRLADMSLAKGLWQLLLLTLEGFRPAVTFVLFWTLGAIPLDRMLRAWRAASLPTFMTEWVHDRGMHLHQNELAQGWTPHVAGSQASFDITAHGPLARPGMLGALAACTTVDIDRSGKYTVRDEMLWTTVVLRLPDTVAERFETIACIGHNHTRTLADMPAGRVVELESSNFSNAYELRVSRDQDGIAVRELFDPTLIEALSVTFCEWQLVDGDLLVWRLGHPHDGDSLDALCRQASYLYWRLVAEVV